MSSIRILIADDHPVVMKGFATALADHGIDVVGQGKTPDDACSQYDQLLPDVVVLDIRFGEQLTGLDAAQQILSKHPDAKIIFLTQFDQESLIKETYRMGGKAFITKDCDSETLADAVRRVHIGETYFLPQIAERLANLAIRGDMSPQSLLDSREVEIFVLMAQGQTNAEIAEKLDLSPKTISNTSQGIKKKLDIHRSADITRMAVKHGLLQA